jgi:hypothetical protein
MIPSRITSPSMRLEKNRILISGWTLRSRSASSLGSASIVQTSINASPIFDSADSTSRIARSASSVANT